MDKNIFLIVFLVNSVLPAAHSHAKTIGKVQHIEQAFVDVKTVYTKAMRGSNKTVSYERNGTGVIIDPSGLIATNKHTVVHAPLIFVVFKDGTKMEAKIVHVSKKYDLCFLKINPRFALNTVALADSSKLRREESIMVVGGSRQNHHKFLPGKITRVINDQSTGTTEFLEVNLNLQRGDSGSPVLDQHGRLLGMITAKRKNQERSVFALSSDKIREQYALYKNTHAKITRRP